MVNYKAMGLSSDGQSGKCLVFVNSFPMPAAGLKGRRKQQRDRRVQTWHHEENNPVELIHGGSFYSKAPAIIRSTGAGKLEDLMMAPYISRRGFESTVMKAGSSVDC
ncbi:MAG: hypothetical protein LAO78_20375 [Acidobacteriia bacterium]|nr:hypothetical protein [Terriglobia bacterium]